MLFCPIIRKFCEMLAVEENITPTLLDITLNGVHEWGKKAQLLTIVLKQKFMGCLYGAVKRQTLGFGWSGDLRVVISGC